MIAPVSFIDAVIQQLSAQCGVSFGEQLPAVPKFGTDYAVQVPLPYAVLTEMGGPRTFLTRGAYGTPYFTQDTLAVSVFGAAPKISVRQLGDLIESALNGNEDVLGFASLALQGRVMAIRSNEDGRFQPVQDVAPESPTVYHYLLTFSYSLQMMRF